REEANRYIDRLLQEPFLNLVSNLCIRRQEAYFKENRQTIEDRGMDRAGIAKIRSFFKIHDGVIDPGSIFEPNAIVFGYPFPKDLIDRFKAIQNEVSNLFGEVIHSPAAGCIFYRSPGEKLHELMIPEDEARHTLEFEDHFVIQPDFHWWTSEERLMNIGGTKCPDGYSYRSNTNDKWLTVEDIRKLLTEI
ncbi:MAG: hypothetical protein QXH80_03945, partial [Candidatus Nanoarchaeia archaeon]